MYNHVVVIQRQFDGDADAYKRWVQIHITERRAILHSSLAIISAKAAAIGDTIRVKPSMLVSLKKEEKALDKSFADCKEMILQLPDFDIDHARPKMRSSRQSGISTLTSNPRSLLPLQL